MNEFTTKFLQLFAALTASILFSAISFNYGFFQVVGIEYFYILSAQDLFKSILNIWYILLFFFAVHIYVLIKTARSNNSNITFNRRVINFRIWRSYIILFVILLNILIFSLIFDILNVLYMLLLSIIALITGYLTGRRAIFMSVYSCFILLLFLSWLLGQNIAYNSLQDSEAIIRIIHSEGAGNYQVLRFLDSGALVREAGTRSIIYIPWGEVLSVRSGDVPPRPDPLLKIW